MSSPSSNSSAAAPSPLDGKRKRNTISESTINESTSGHANAPKQKTRKTEEMLSAGNAATKSGDKKKGKMPVKKARKIEGLALKVFTTDKALSRVLHFLDAKTCFAFLRIQGRDPESGGLRRVWKSEALRERLMLAPANTIDNDGEQDASEAGEGTRSPYGGKGPYGVVHQLNPSLFAGQVVNRKYIHNIGLYTNPSARWQDSLIPTHLVGPDFKVEGTFPNRALVRDESGQPVPEEFMELHFITHPALDFARDPNHLTLKDHVELNTTLARSLLTKPAIEDAEVGLRGYRTHKTGDDSELLYWERRYLHKDGGIRMGDIFQLAIEFSDKHVHKGARIGQEIVYEVRFPRGMYFAIGEHAERLGPLSKKEFEQL